MYRCHGTVREERLTLVCSNKGQPAMFWASRNVQASTDWEGITPGGSAAVAAPGSCCAPSAGSPHPS